MTGIPGRVMIIIGVTILCVLFTVAGVKTMQAAAQATFSVTNLNDSGPGSLRQAILEANATPGADVIHITANGQLNLLSPLPIINEAVTIFVPDANTFRIFKIDGQNLHRGLTIAAVPVTITGLTVQNSVATGDLRGGGIKSDGPLTLNNVTILNNSAQAVGGGLFSTGVITVNGGRFEGNQAWGNGGGIFATGPLIINGGVIRNNHCVTQFCKGGGLYASQALTLTHTQIISNTALQSGGGAYAQGSLAATGSVVQGNRCTDSFCDGGGLYAQSALFLAATEIRGNRALGRGGGALALGAVEISGGRFEANVSDRDGGGLLAAGPLTASNALWLHNSAQTNGGGTAVQGDGPVHLTDSHFENNSGGDGGGGMSISSADATLTGVTFAGNHSAGGGGGLKAWNVTLIGGRFEENSATLGVGALQANSVALTGTHFIRNSPGGASVSHITASHFLFEGNSLGSAISAIHTVTLRDGQIVNNSGASAVSGAIVEATNALFADNTGAFVGGSALTASQRAAVSDSLFVNNSSNTASGGVGATGELTITDSLFIFNRGDVGGGVRASGNLTITGAIFRENQARLGGGVAHDAGDSLIVNTLFDNNSASDGGAAVFLQGSGTDYLTHVTIAGAGVVTSTAVATTKEILLIRNTILVNHAVGLHVGAGFVVLDSTLFHGNGADIQGVVSFDQNRIAANPLFTNPGAGNYRLQSGSPAIDAGLDVGVFVDFEGDVRPSLAGFDIGYDEYVPAQPVQIMLPIIIRQSE
jgi:predicted outer membrane repeat protein